MQLKKRGYFFVLDAMLGLFVLIIGVFLITSSYVSVPQPAEARLVSDDLLDFLSNVKIKEFNNPYGGIGGQLWSQGAITEPENSLLQQIGEFYAAGNFDTAENFIQNATAGVIPLQFRYEVWMNGAILYPRAPPPEHMKSKNATGILLTSKKPTFGVINEATGDLWGPYKAEVFVWER